MFGKPRAVKKLEKNMAGTRLSFIVFPRMPDGNREFFMRTAPEDLAQSVRKAVSAGHGDAARVIVEQAAGSVPEGATPEQWQYVLGPSVAALA